MTVVYENRSCRVVQLDDGSFELVRLRDGVVVGSFPAGERGRERAVGQADTAAGPVGRAPR